MNNEAPEATEARSLTVDDPVEAEKLEQFRGLQEAQQALAESLLALEMEKVRILAAAKRVNEQRDRLFESINIDRGLPPNARVDIDARTGKITLIEEPATPV